MKQIKQYIFDTLGIEIQPKQVTKQSLDSLPIYIGETYKLYDFLMLDRLLLLAEPKQTEDFSILQTEKHFDLLKIFFGRKIILLLSETTAFNRKRLIEKGINFIIPNKQMYLPDLLIDLKENFSNPKAKRKNETLLPSAQFLLIYYIAHGNDAWQLEKHSFKEIAKKTGYTAMAITKAVENLKNFELIIISGGKEKFIRFKLERRELWDEALHRNLLITPVLKKVYVDEKPIGIPMLHSNTSALPEYTDMNPDRQEYFALEKKLFYELQKNNALINTNEKEGKYCLEIWKYNPGIIKDINKNEVVDPLSLYLSLKDSKDERIEMALEQIINQFTW